MTRSQHKRTNMTERSTVRNQSEGLQRYRLFPAFSSLVGILPVCLFFTSSAPVRAQDDIADVRSQDLRAGGDEQKRYFLIGPAKGGEPGTKAKPPKDGYKLLVVLPGGGGGEDFQPFVKRIFAKALPEGWLVAQPVAVSWAEDQAKKLVWPTKRNPWKDMKFSTEEFVEAVIADIGKEHKLDPKHVYTLSWSSGGPAAYAISLQEKTAVRGSFIAMSVFKPDELPALDTAKGRAYYLYQSPDDKVCKFSFVQDAKKTLSKHGARVKLCEYGGGHGWHGDVFGDIRRGIEWLQKDSRKSEAKSDGDAKETEDKDEKVDQKKKSGGAKKAAKEGKETGKVRGKNLLANGGFEDGQDPWNFINNSGRLEHKLDKKVTVEGKQSLRLSKTGGMPMDVIRYDLDDLPRGAKVKVSAQVKAKGVKNAFLKFFVYDENENSLIEDVDIARVTGTADWNKVEKTFDVPKKAKSAAVMFVLVLDGTVWLDDVRVEAIKE